jgi:glutaminase
VWSPALEYSGNSYAGSIDQEMLTTLKGPMMF